MPWELIAIFRAIAIWMNLWTQKSTRESQLWRPRNILFYANYTIPLYSITLLIFAALCAMFAASFVLLLLTTPAPRRWWLPIIFLLPIASTGLMSYVSLQRIWSCYCREEYEISAAGLIRKWASEEHNEISWQDVTRLSVFGLWFRIVTNERSDRRVIYISHELCNFDEFARTVLQNVDPFAIDTRSQYWLRQFASDDSRDVGGDGGATLTQHL